MRYAAEAIYYILRFKVFLYDDCMCVSGNVAAAGQHASRRAGAWRHPRQAGGRGV